MATEDDVVALVNELVQGGYVTPVDVVCGNVDRDNIAVDEAADVSDRPIRLLSPPELKSWRTSRLHITESEHSRP